MNDRPTPETDAAAEAVGMGHFMVDSDFARKLERERDEAREERDLARKEINHYREKNDLLPISWDV